MSKDEAMRLRRLSARAAPYLVPADAYCKACNRTLISIEHAEDCPIGALEQAR